MSSAAGVAAGDCFWIVACSAAEQSREAINSILLSRVLKNGLASNVMPFDVPLTLKFGTFDDLIRLGDELAKHDGTCEQIVRRLERQVLEIDSTAELRIFHQRTTRKPQSLNSHLKAVTMEEYLRRFTWDEAKYPKMRNLRDNVAVLMTSIGRLDDDVRVKAAAYAETRQSAAVMAKRETGSLVQRDLIDVLTPQVVRADDFIETEHLTTVCAVMPKSVEDSWVKSYESMNKFVVPRSSRKFEVVDKEGYSIWNVTLLKSALEEFRLACKAKRVTIREFKYDPTALQRKQDERRKLESEKEKQETFMSRVCLTSFSDASIAWIHLKATRVFVEATLRFGVPVNFAAFLLKPSKNKERRLRKELDDVFTTKGMFGRALIEGESKSTSEGDKGGTAAALAAELGEDEYYPYVSLSIQPFALFVQK